LYFVTKGVQKHLNGVFGFKIWKSKNDIFVV